ncbi:class III lanthionine synthetase LanKC [Streptomyces sp. FXJ1.4098]|nr:class III lanthionine synthetase LanKC [Streptomyces sp. FXJ1.4098]
MEDGTPRPGRPNQGWKVHVSACLDNAEKTAAKVWDYCVPREIPFKFVPTAHALHLRNSKYAGRGSSGKFATIYPADEAELHTILRELGELLAGEPGPYILTDLRWQEGPLYVRYGGFAQRFCVDDAADADGSGAGGTLVPAIEDPSGRLVPDRRDPAFHVPEWVTLPDFLAPQLAARNATTVADLPYRIEKALHFSNGGGVYVGTDTRTGAKVVLKEARPYAGLASDGADAVTRLEREKAALERLSGLGVAPEVRDWFTLGDHRFLVMDHIAGRTLNSFFAQRHPLLSAEPDPAAVAEYTRWALRIHSAVEEAVAAVHGRGVVFNDLHMFNIMVSPDELSVMLLDFEAAAHIGEGRRQAIAHPGFVAPLDRRGFEVDRYALACLRLALFVPMTTLLVVDRGKAAHLAEVAAGQFPVDRAFLAEAVEVIAGDGHGAYGGHGGSAGATDGGGSAGPRGRRAAAAVRTSPWTPRTGPTAVTRWPAPSAPRPRPSATTGSSRATSASSPMAAGSGGARRGGCAPRARPDRRRTVRGGGGVAARAHRPPPRGTPLGFYDGLAGVAYVLERLGHTERALELIERVLDEKWQRLAPDLYGGLAGVGLTLEHLARATGETGLRERADEAVRLLADRLDGAAGATGAAGAAGARLTGKRAGLLHGATGPALLFLRLYEHSGDPAHLDLAATALRQDLDRCVRDRHGTLLVDEGSAPCRTWAREVSGSGWSSTAGSRTAPTTTSRRYAAVSRPRRRCATTPSRGCSTAAPGWSCTSPAPPPRTSRPNGWPHRSRPWAGTPCRTRANWPSPASR